ncbi:hypothetical protein FSPOR_8381 [Fusarium sporotrichioides]|uniref:Uncharacterized protein n=1 Tax=Fusarium sporotrichioides TaxID=5514 RepID=A0A395RUV3_FUSSP|nr:hypothetical protein FSPOR_8381 [Fusarium sporotrichioides]
MNHPSEECSELDELMLDPQVPQTQPPHSLSYEEGELCLLQGIDIQPPTQLGSDVHTGPLPFTSMLVPSPLADINTTFVDQYVDLEFNAMDGVEQLSCNIEQVEFSTIDTWPSLSFDATYDPPSQASATIAQNNNIHNPHFDPFWSNEWSFQDLGGEHIFDNGVEIGPPCNLETGQFEQPIDDNNQFLCPPLDFQTHYNDQNQDDGIGETHAHSQGLLIDATSLSSNPMTILNASAVADTTVATQIPKEPLPCQSELDPDQQGTQSILSTVSGSAAQELCSNSHLSLVATGKRKRLPVEAAAAPPNSFGPVRPVTLPPLRRGGRKGPLSAQERQARNAMRNRGVAAAGILLSILDKAVGIDPPTSDHVTQIVNAQPDPTAYHQHPILIPPPSKHEGHSLDLNYYSMFCVLSKFEFTSWENPRLSSVPDEEAADMGLMILNILVSITRRRLEQQLFHWLQFKVNKLYTLTPSQLSHTATLLLRLLIFGDEKFHWILGENENQPMSLADRSQRRLVRQALFSYLKMVIDKLPEWSDFWNEQAETFILTNPQLLRLSFSDMETSNKRLSRMKSCLKQSLDSYEVFREVFKDSKDTSEISDEKFTTLIKDLADGSYAMRTIRGAIQRQQDFHQKKVREKVQLADSALRTCVDASKRSLISVFKRILVWLEDEIEASINSQQQILQCLEGLSNFSEGAAVEINFLESIEVPVLPMEAVDMFSEALEFIVQSSEGDID